jgi:exodeoxyribonuclease VII small subunit
MNDRDADDTTPPPQPAEAAQPASFEDALGQLAELVAKLESGSLGLSDSIAGYERGVAILRQLHEELARAEERVSVLVRIDEDGRPVLAPQAVSEPPDADQPAATRARSAGRRKSPPARTLPGMDEPSKEA